MTFADILNLIGHQPTWVLYVVIFALIFGESAFLLGLVLPGEVAAIVGGVLAGTSLTQLTLVVVGTFLAAALGDATGYTLGRRTRRRLRGSQWASRTSPLWARLARLMRRHTFTAVALGRTMVVVRSIMPSVSGMVGVERRTFALYNLVGCLLWTAPLALIGYAVGPRMRHLALTYEDEAYTAATLLVLAYVLVNAVVYLRSRRARRLVRASEIAISGQPHADPALRLR